MFCVAVHDYVVVVGLTLMLLLMVSACVFCVYCVFAHAVADIVSYACFVLLLYTCTGTRRA